MSSLRFRSAGIPVLNLAYHSGIYRLVSRFWGGCGVIFSLHRFAEPGKSILHPGHVLHTDILDEVLETVQQLGWEIISIDQVYERLSSGAYTGKKGTRLRSFACFTIDDGYEDNLSLALPVFRKHKAPFCVYIATCFLERSVFLWTAPNEELVVKSKRIDLPAIGDVGPRTLYTETFEQKVAAYHVLDGLCHSFGDTFSHVIRQIYERHGIDPRHHLDRLALTLDQARQLASDPLVTIGSHTVTHPRLSRLSEEAVYGEMEESRRKLEGWLNVEVRHFAYPFGRSDACGPREFALAKRAGFRTALTTRPGNIFPEHGDHLHCLPRRSIPFRKFRLRNVLFGMETILKNEPRFQTK